MKSLLVRAWLNRKRYKPFKASEIADDLKLSQTYVGALLASMVKRGDLVKVARGVFVKA